MRIALVAFALALVACGSSHASTPDASIGDADVSADAGGPSVDAAADGDDAGPPSLVERTRAECLRAESECPIPGAVRACGLAQVTAYVDSILGCHAELAALLDCVEPIEEPHCREAVRASCEAQETALASCAAG
jgi:hypothetical protein